MVDLRVLRLEQTSLSPCTGPSIRWICHVGDGKRSHLRHHRPMPTVRHGAQYDSRTSLLPPVAGGRAIGAAVGTRIESLCGGHRGLAVCVIAKSLAVGLFRTADAVRDVHLVLPGALGVGVDDVCGQASPFSRSDAAHSSMSRQKALLHFWIDHAPWIRGQSNCSAV